MEEKRKDDTRSGAKSVLENKEEFIGDESKEKLKHMGDKPPPSSKAERK
jgi:hypothetical protein